MRQVEKYARCSCQSCGQGIEFPVVLTHEHVPCPSCKCLIRLPSNEFWPGLLSNERQNERMPNREKNYREGMFKRWVANYPGWRLGIDPSVERVDWKLRWQQAGGPANDQFIALKSDPVWHRLGDPRLFPDGFGKPYPPYSNGSGVVLLPASRAEMAELGFELPPPYLPPEFLRRVARMSDAEKLDYKKRLEGALSELNEKR